MNMTKSEQQIAREQSLEHKKTGYNGVDSREGRLHNTKTDRGVFRFKDNRKDE